MKGEDDSKFSEALDPATWNDFLECRLPEVAYDDECAFFLFILSINCFPQVGNSKVHLSWLFLYFKLQKDTDQINQAPVNTIFLHAEA